MLRFANALADSNEYAIADWGQSNKRPWGDRDGEGFQEMPTLALSPNGMDLTILSIASVGVGHGDVGSQSIVTVAESLAADYWKTDGELRLVYVNWGVRGEVMRPGHAKVISNTASTLLVEWVSALKASVAITSFAAAGTTITATAHGFAVDDPVQFGITNGSLPSAVVPGVTYYVVSVPTADTFTIASELGGPAITFASDDSGDGVVYIGTLRNVGGYVRLTNDRWKTYDIVRVLHAYQPEEPGPYPSFAKVPGYAHPSTVTSYEDCGLFLPFAWDEGIDGPGAVGACTIASLTATITGGQTITDKVFAGGILIVNDGSKSAYGVVASNTPTTVTVTSWVGTVPTGTIAFELLIPHWRDNPRRALQGFRYPSNDMMPGGYASTSPGTTYNRPAKRFATVAGNILAVESSYKAGLLTQGNVRTDINASGLAQVRGAVTAGLRATLAASGRLRIARLLDMTILDRSTAKQQLYFTELVVPGQMVFVAGWPTGGSGTVTINTETNTISWPGHTLSDGQVVQFLTTGQLPNGIRPATDFYDFAPLVVSISAASDTVTATAHGLPEGTPVMFTGTPDALPAQITTGTTYYLRNVQTNTFQVSRTRNGALIDFGIDADVTMRPAISRYYVRDTVAGVSFKVALTSGGAEIDLFGVQSGVHTAYGEDINGTWRVQAVSGPRWTNSGGSTVTIPLASPCVITKVAHGLVDGDMVSFQTTGKLPDGLTPGTSYLVDMLTADTFQLFTIDTSTGAPLPGSVVNTSGIQDGVHSIFNQGSYIDIEAADKPLPASVAYQFADDNVVVQRASIVVHHRFGSMLPNKWKLATMIGKRLNVVLLGVNSSGQFFAPLNNNFAFQGRIGWFDDDFGMTWTPSDPNGIAWRFKKMLTLIAPAALIAEGNTKPLRYLAIDGMQGEAESIDEAGRAIYDRTLPALYAFIRDAITKAGLSAYSGQAKIPIQHAKIPHDPWELEGDFYGQHLIGDLDGLVNAAIANFVARDGFAVSIDVDDLPKMDGTNVWFPPSVDPLHYNGHGEAILGQRSADAIAPLIELALSLCTNDPAAVDICNLALSHIGDTAQVSSIDPPDGSVQAQHCARYYPMARDAVLAMRPWSFASRRVALTEVTNTRTEWQHAYDVPRDVMFVHAVTASDASDDWVEPTAPVLTRSARFEPPPQQRGSYTSQDYVIERDTDGNRVLYTNQEAATLRYQAITTDASLFPPLFKLAVSWQLAAMLAGPLIKGDQGAEEAKRATQMMLGYLAQASETDANQRQSKPKQITPWIARR